MSAALLLLADGRFPSGAHAHSFGVEAAVGVGDVRDVASLGDFVRGRVATVGVVEAAFAAAACRDGAPWIELDTELAARTASPAVRAASRALGRQLLRAAERVWPSPLYRDVRAATPAEGPFQPLALAAVAGVAGLTPTETALCSLHHLVGATTTAAVRLLGLDPFAVAALSAGLAPGLQALAAEAADAAARAATAGELPSSTSLLADVLAEHHATWEVRLFAS